MQLSELIERMENLRRRAYHRGWTEAEFEVVATQARRATNLIMMENFLDDLEKQVNEGKQPKELLKT